MQTRDRQSLDPSAWYLYHIRARVRKQTRQGSSTDPTRRPLPPPVQCVGQKMRVTSDFFRLDAADACTPKSVLSMNSAMRRDRAARGGPTTENLDLNFLKDHCSRSHCSWFFFGRTQKGFAELEEARELVSPRGTATRGSIASSSSRIFPASAALRRHGASVRRPDHCE